MWTKLYRPKRVDDIVGNQNIIKTIKSMMPEIPHMIFKGKAGVGKTTTALAIVNDLRCEYLELNASDESGIGVVRGKIKNFVSTSSLNKKFKIVILDEADETTNDFQTALRRLMEKYQLNARFIFTCNNPQNIIEPIKSRCSGGIFEFLPIEYSEFKRGILNILKQEQMTITEEALVKLHELSKGDMRIIDKLYQISFTTKNVTLSDIINIKDDETWKELLKLIKEGDYTKSCKISKKEYIVPIFQYLISDSISNDKKMKITRNVAEWEYRKHFAETDYIQLYALIANLIPIFKEEPKELKSLFGNKK